MRLAFTFQTLNCYTIVQSAFFLCIDVQASPVGAYGVDEVVDGGWADTKAPSPDKVWRWYFLQILSHCFLLSLSIPLCHHVILFRQLRMTDDHQNKALFGSILGFLHSGSGNTMQSVMTDVVEVERLCNRIQWRSDMFREDYYQACLSKLLQMTRKRRDYDEAHEKFHRDRTCFMEEAQSFSHVVLHGVAQHITNDVGKLFGCTNNIKVGGLMECLLQGVLVESDGGVRRLGRELFYLCKDVQALFKTGQKYDIWTSPHYGPDKVLHVVEEMKDLLKVNVEADRLFPTNVAEATDGNQWPCQWAC